MNKNFLKNKQFWLLSLSSLFFFMSFNMIIPELPDYLEKIGGGNINVGYIIGSFTLIAMLSRPISGKLTDTIGRMPVMIFGAGIAFVASILYPIWITISGFFILRLVHGMSTGFKPTATAAYMSDIIPADKRGEAMGILGVLGSIGMAAGPVIGSWVKVVWGFSFMFVLAGCISLLSVLIFLGMKETLPVENRKPFSLKLLKITPQDFYEPAVLLPSVLFMCSVASFGVVVSIIPDFSEFLGTDNKGLFFSYMLVASILVRVFAGRISDKKGRSPVIKVGLVLLFIAMLVIGNAHTTTQLYVGGFLYGMARGIYAPTYYAWVTDRSDTHNRGRAFATMYILFELGITLGAVFSGLYYQNQIENVPAIFYSVAGLALIALAGLIVIDRKKSTQRSRT